MKFKLILVALLLAFLLAFSASAVSAADDAALESASDGDIIAPTTMKCCVMNN